VAAPGVRMGLPDAPGRDRSPRGLVTPVARSSYTEFVTSIDAHRAASSGRSFRRRTGARLGALLAAAVLGTAVLAGCGGDNSQTDCNLNSCTITFERGVDASVSVLGIDAKLVSVQNSQATVEVAGQQVTVPVGQDAQSEGFNVSVQSITADNVVVKISAN